MAHCIECGTGLPRGAIRCPDCAVRRASRLDTTPPGAANLASFLVIEPEVLIAPVQLVTGSPPTPEANSRSRIASVVIAGCLAIAILIVLIARVLVN